MQRPGWQLHPGGNGPGSRKKGGRIADRANLAMRLSSFSMVGSNE
jgi:hypothetical protein